MVIFKDVTERKQAELTRARLAAIVECSDDAIIGKNLDGIIQTWNAAAERIFGYTPQEAIGRPIGIIFPPERAKEGQSILERIRRGERIEQYESVRRRKDGRLFDVSLTISHVTDANGQIVGASKIARDITERKLAEKALIKSEKLAAAGRLAATLAHEINNPLQAVTNLMSLLGKAPGLNEQEQSFAAMAEGELRRVVHLTQQSLSFYRESTHATVVSVEEVLDSVVSLYAKRLATEEISVVKRYRSQSSTITSYPGEIRQVFSTLLVNAMEATPARGTICLRVSKTVSMNPSPTQGVRVSVVDDGIGIPAHDKASIFEPFFTTKGEQGTGLGLWVANGIVNRLGGSIRMRSCARPGQSGTCFSVFFPKQVPKKRSEL